MVTNAPEAEYEFDATAPCNTDYINPVVVAECKRLGVKRVLDLGCGNGVLCGALAKAGFDMVGCDPSESGVKYAREAFPDIPFHLLGIYDDPSVLGSDFDMVVSTEVVEHIYLPRFLPQFAARVLKPSGYLLLTTPYHGYLKNLMLAITGKLDNHFTALWDGGHIKFWSRATLSKLVQKEGFAVTHFMGAGRIPYLWKSMVLVARRN